MYCSIEGFVFFYSKITYRRRNLRQLVLSQILKIIFFKWNIFQWSYKYKYMKGFTVSFKFHFSPFPKIEIIFFFLECCWSKKLLKQFLNIPECFTCRLKDDQNYFLENLSYIKILQSFHKYSVLKWNHT